MKKSGLLLILIAFCNIIFTSCKKNSVEEQYNETIQPVVPDLSTQINSGVAGFITDENGEAVEGAVIKGSTSVTVTDSYGYFRISSSPFPKSAGFIQVIKTGFFSGYRTFIPQENKESFVRLQLIPKSNTGSLDAATGGIVTTVEGATVTIPSEAVVVASTGLAYTGIVNVAVHWLNPSAMDVTQLNMPGDLRGIDSSGYLNALTTYGMLAVELTDVSGNLLQISAGKKASLTFPLPASLQGIAPSSIPLWYFDESNGLWKQDGNANKSGNNYQGEVSHFSYWNCDVPNSLVNFTAQIVNSSLQPVPNIAVSVMIEGIPGSIHTDYTNSNGTVSGMIPANSSLIVKAGSACNPFVYSKNIQTANAAVDLGSIKIDLQQYGATFSGTVNKCNGLPVTNGYVIISSPLYSHAIEIQNGVFEAAGFICSNTNASVVVFDREASQQSVVQSISLTNGLNNFGALSTCGPAISERIQYILDGTPGILEPPFYLFDGSFWFGGSTTHINVYDQINTSTAFDITFSGPDASGGAHTVTGNMILHSNNYSGTFSNVTISSYGLIGEFISGSFTANLTDIIGDPHTFSCTFNVYRDQ